MNGPVAVDDPVIRRLSDLPEDRVLDYFWLLIRRGAVRIDALLQVGKVVIQRPHDWDFRSVRIAHEQGGQPRVHHPDLSRCFACGRAERLFYHHIVEVQHGGSNQARNLVPLDFGCHKRLHPWLKEPERRSGMVRVGECGNTLGFEIERFVRDGAA